MQFTRISILYDFILFCHPSDNLINVISCFIEVVGRSVRRFSFFLIFEFCFLFLLILFILFYYPFYHLFYSFICYLLLFSLTATMFLFKIEFVVDVLGLIIKHFFIGISYLYKEGRKEGRKELIYLFIW